MECWNFNTTLAGAGRVPRKRSSWAPGVAGTVRARRGAPATRQRSGDGRPGLGQNGTVTSYNASNRKPKMTLGMRANLVVAALVVLLGPVLMVVGNFQINADAELVRTGQQAVGVITQFNDGSQASQRKIRVEFQSDDASVHSTWATVDSQQHPAVGKEVTVAYRESDPGDAEVLGFESEGVFNRGVGTVLTSIFGAIGVILAIRHHVAVPCGTNNCLFKRRTASEV